MARGAQRSMYKRAVSRRRLPFRSTYLCHSSSRRAFPPVRATASEAPHAPQGEGASMQELIRFAVPALALYLVNPSLSLIDTALIGQFDSTHLASLAPSTMLLDYPAYLLTLLGISTQNLVATELGKNNVDAASEALSDGMSIALGVGFLMCGLSALLVKPLLEIICSGSSVSLIAPAVQYVNIRSTTWPAVTITSVLQSTLLARGDVINPVKAAWASALVNLVLDWLLIGRYGIAGAAVATVATQLLVLVMQARALDLGYRFKRVSAARAQEFVALAGPVGLTNGMKIVFYAAVTLSASRLGVVQTAAHQILVRIYIFIILFAEPLGQFAQTMLPQAFVRQDVRSALQTTLKLVTASLVLGVVLATGFMAIPLGAAIFTSDLAVTTTLQSVAPVALFAASVMAPLTSVTDGTLVAQRRLWYLFAATTACTLFSVGLLCFSPPVRESLTRIWLGASSYLIGRSILHCFLLLGPNGWLRSDKACEHYLAAA